MKRVLKRIILPALLWPFGVIAFEIKWARVLGLNKYLRTFPTYYSPLWSLLALATGAVLTWLSAEFYTLMYEFGLVSYNLATHAPDWQIGYAVFVYILGVALYLIQGALLLLELQELRLIRYAQFVLLGGMLGVLIPL